MDTHSTASYTSSSIVAFLGVLTLQDWALLIGIVFTVLTFAVNTYYKHKAFKLHERKVDSADQAVSLDEQ